MLLLKAIGWRLIASLTTMIVTLYVTGNVTVALSIGLTDTIIKIFLYYAYDVLWFRFTTRKYKPSVVWLTGLSGAGKTTIAREVQSHLSRHKHPVMLLDGDEIRNLFPGTGFDEASRKQHILKVAQIAIYLQSQGITAIVSLISPYRDTRDEIRKMAKNFVEVYVSTPIAVCEERDPKGLYKKARAGEVKQFTGIDSPYEQPLSPELDIDTSDRTVAACADLILRRLK